MSGIPMLAFAEDGNHLVASILPSTERPALSPEALRAALADSGYADWILDEEALGRLVDAFNSRLPEIQLPIGERHDASFSVVVADDAMQAWIDLIPAHGGQPLDIDRIILALGAAGVTFGIDEAAVAALCARSASGATERVPVASGRKPEDGRDTRFEMLVDDARDRAPRVDENGLIDFRDLGAIPVVAADQPLMRRIPPTTGIDGCDVRGHAVQAQPGRNEPFAEHLAGAYVSPDDANLLLAVYAGQPVRVRNGVNVEQVLRLRNVNMASGNIDFDGTVSIDGEILPGMKVHATRDIIVDDVIDGAEVEAGGDVRVGGGIIAKAVVRAGGSIAARFVENASLSAGTNIAIDDTALQSELQANNQIAVGAKNPRGRLAGGSARATMLIVTPLLGLASGGVTRLLLGVNPALESQYQELLKRIEQVRIEEDNLGKLVKHLGKPGSQPELLERAKSSWQKALRTWGELMPQREDLEKQLALVARARVDISSGVEGAIDMTFGKKALRLRQPCAAGSFVLDGDEIVFVDLAQRPAKGGAQR